MVFRGQESGYYRIMERLEDHVLESIMESMFEVSFFDFSSFLFSLNCTAFVSSPFREPLHPLGKDFIIMKMLPCETPESLSEFKPPPSPISSYDNQPLNNSDFSKPPPELPPQLPTKIFDERSFVSRKPKSSRRPSHTLLNHLYKQDGDDGQSMALCSTQRFLQKYVTVVLYKSVHR
ncbi:5'-AMP-activated protein kinase beta-2 subunit protein [Hibiscus syriacus]|uniref:5'-AMP-activated protein kinase beta-2 subunit protein n=1 Tax=Hibiscus syriacus TaxID=106335 RepID=A0A6A2Z2E5_HIBSY|nr:5'-AMP-activated protein kinase beta-2 subunit protein [Hibiscus syriacus]